MKWSFIVFISKKTKIDKNITNLIEKRSEECIETLGRSTESDLYRVNVIFYQKSSRWRTNDPSIPREDIGIDLDNLLQYIFDGLGPIIGYRNKYDWSSGKPVLIENEYSGVLDSKILEVNAKKVNSGSDEEYLGIEVETI